MQTQQSRNIRLGGRTRAIGRSRGGRTRVGELRLDVDAGYLLCRSKQRETLQTQGKDLKGPVGVLLDLQYNFALTIDNAALKPANIGAQDFFFTIFLLFGLVRFAVVVRRVVVGKPTAKVTADKEKYNVVI